MTEPALFDLEPEPAGQVEEYEDGATSCLTCGVCTTAAALAGAGVGAHGPAGSTSCLSYRARYGLRDGAA